MILKALAAIDLHANALALAEVVASFPGVYQMLPTEFRQAGRRRPQAHLHRVQQGAGSPVTQALLDQARDFHERKKRSAIPTG